MFSLQDLKDFGTVAGGIGTAILALIAVGAGIPRVQETMIQRIGRAFNRETIAAIDNLSATVAANHAEGLERFEANEKAIKATRADVEGVAETLDTVAVMGQHTRRTLNGHIRSGRHLPKKARGTP